MTKVLYWTLWRNTFVITCLISIFLFVFVEKQGINARITFKNKYEKAARHLSLNKDLLADPVTDSSNELNDKSKVNESR